MKTVMKKIGAWLGAFVVGSVATVAAAQTVTADDSSKTPVRKVNPQDVQNMPMPQAKQGSQTGESFKDKNTSPASIKISDDAYSKRGAEQKKNDPWLKRGAEQKKDDLNKGKAIAPDTATKDGK